MEVVTERLREWISVELERDDRTKVAVLLVQVCIQLGLRVKEASTAAGELVGKTERTVREWRQDFFRNEGSFREYQRGKHVRQSIIDDEAARKEAMKFVRENAYKKGKPNMTACMFHLWVNSDLLPCLTLDPSLPRKIGVETARLWLHELGFQPLKRTKGLYIDGHERPDVVQYMKSFLTKLSDLEQSHLPPPATDAPVPFVPQGNDDGRKYLVIIHHDESIFHANDDQMYMWGESDTHNDPS